MLGIPTVAQGISGISAAPEPECRFNPPAQWVKGSSAATARLQLELGSDPWCQKLHMLRSHQKGWGSEKKRKKKKKKEMLVTLFFSILNTSI